MANERKPALVFDLDGTLIDSAPDVAHALNRLLAEKSRPALTLEQVQELVGEGAGALIERAWLATGTAAALQQVPDLVARYLEFYQECPADHTVIFDDVVAVLQQFAAAGHPMGICTNKPHDMTMIVLKCLGLDHFFQGVVGGDVITRRKPDGEHILETLRRMNAGLPAVMVGDSATDVAAARAAGVPVVAVSYGYARMDPRNLGADVLIDHFGQLPASLSKVLS